MNCSRKTGETIELAEKGGHVEIPLLDLKAQYRTIKKEIDEAVARVVASQGFILGDDVASLEKEIAYYVNTGFAAGVASGTDALILALRALDIGKGDSVITTPFTFFATAEAISLVGARPVFADIDQRTYNIDPGKVAEILEKSKGRANGSISAVIPVHLYGQCADMTEIMKLAAKYKLKVIEDTAQAIGAVHSGKKAGSFGNAAALSFFPSKNLGGFGDGGMVVSPDPALIERVKKLRVHGSKEIYIHEEIGYNSRLDTLQAAVLRVKLKKLDSWLDGRRAVAAKYNAAFSPIGIKTPETAKGNTHTYHQYTIAVKDREGLAAHLKSRGVPARVYYPVPLHLQECYRDLGYKKGDMPVSEKMSGEVISLPIYPELTTEMVDHIIKSVKSFF